MKFLSYLLVAVISFGIAYVVTQTSDTDAVTYDFSSVANAESEWQDSTAYATYYQQLNEYQKALYLALLEPISEAKEKIVLTNTNVEDFYSYCDPVFTAIQYDHPELFWFTGGFSATTTHETFEEMGEAEIELLYYQYVSSMFDSEKKRAQLEERVKEVAALARAHSDDDYERIIFVHDYLIENAYYDHDALDEYFRTTHSPSCEYIFSAYGCLVEGKTVCSGYAKAFQLVLTELGYDCSYVTGDAGEAHGWNCVYLNGEGYYVDVTWDDMDLDREIPIYDYAFINDEELKRTHTIDMKFDAPVCNATDYNFFVKRGYYLETYDFEAATAILATQTAEDAAYIKFGSIEELGRAYNDLVEKSNLHKVDALKVFTAAYYNEDLRTLTVIKK